jgi:hypothetical protein
MLQVTIPGVEFYDEENEIFIETKGQELCLEHSLVSLAKWESKWKKPYYSNDPKTREELNDYIRCMTLTQNVNNDLYLNIPASVIQQINAYIEDEMTATWFSRRNNQRRSRGEVITAEIIYYWMVALNIPFECQKWHLNRLLTLIQVCNLKNEPEKKMNKRQVYENNRALNEARRQKMNTKG